MNALNIRRDKNTKKNQVAIYKRRDEKGNKKTKGEKESER